MPVHVFKTEVIQAVSFEAHYPASEALFPLLQLEISFQNVFGTEYDAWDRNPEGEICIQRLVELTMHQELNYLDLALLTQINIRSRCYHYLRSNDLLCYPNVIPFQWLPYRIPSLSEGRLGEKALLIEFPQG